MTNEEKARQISSRLFDKDEQAGAFETLVITLTEMAEWKDQQFKEYLEKLIKESTGEEAGYFVIRGIINELFKEE